ncbi:GNAT family N-acetyltransferase [Gelatiniphilus marinus]|uniref:GNAT family N-acetyltransferase n=1 Tax=Gelatiniphilus marinus TaxID=1759464 RepID=A0ABW5JQX6_9FLAO
MALPNKNIEVSFFLDLFFKEKSFPFFIKTITNTLLKSVVYKRNAISTLDLKTYAITDIPSYFSLQIDEENANIKSVSVPLYAGFLINLSNFANLEDYLNNKLGRPRKSQLKRYRKRLDLCIAPKYKIFYGAITREDYKLLFKELLLITERRFIQKKELNFELPFLKLYEDMMFDMVLKKQAAIFAIYHGDKPINITLNFIDGETIFHWNSCYNIDYQMFNLGHINMVNHLEWAYNNNFKLFDMSRGDFLHKRKYITESYMYNKSIIFNSKSVFATIIARFTAFKLKLRFKLIGLLKKINFHKLYGYYAKLKFKIKKPSAGDTSENKIIADYNLPEIHLVKNLKEIDLDNKEFSFLIQARNYFLHKSQEFVNDVKVYKDLKNDQIFYFKGIKKNQKTTIQKTS